jgi:hypothetical protein
MTVRCAARAGPDHVVGLFTPISTAASGRYDPRLRFRTISTPRFDIHFHHV